jgi:hypothetical protein
MDRLISLDLDFHAEPKLFATALLSTLPRMLMHKTKGLAHKSTPLLSLRNMATKPPAIKALGQTQQICSPSTC